MSKLSAQGRSASGGKYQINVQCHNVQILVIESFACLPQAEILFDIVILSLGFLILVYLKTLLSANGHSY
ncbi:hypothetical protein A3I40_04120 [Candidatus Uhrbacteria bacterium RIFCSPLOWO2_02_FULL_48_12]|uniref:Uncharacterized protein n=1 Tax=Candidatus Uhrbacteria bacterium RIFCSPLOWO2_02_FULL_48_12 TaxID=1802407 RepID=A0A1F7VA23_9BACT|nr:MAG: hypothetical protein A3I40_04120 [Candidatus Uhrbacteria bacterium RIFCSPLOWO2_02_FULL_48_12]